MGNRTQVPDSVLTGVGLRRVTTLDESFPSADGGGGEGQGDGFEARAEASVGKKRRLTVRGKS